MANNNDYRDDELIDIRLPRNEYQVLKEMLKREEALGWFKSWIRTWWVWIGIGGIISIITLFEKLKSINGIIK